MNVNRETNYRNTDLILTSATTLESLAALFEARGLHSLGVTRLEDGSWFAVFETDVSFEEPDANIAALLDVVETLGAEEKAIWSACAQREFDLGYECGDAPPVFTQVLRSETLARAVAVGAALRVTIYPVARE